MLAIKQFVYDMIHMTEGEKLIYYWPLWLTIVVLITFLWCLDYRKR